MAIKKNLRKSVASVSKSAAKDNHGGTPVALTVEVEIKPTLDCVRTAQLSAGRNRTSLHTAEQEYLDRVGT